MIFESFGLMRLWGQKLLPAFQLYTS